MRAGVRVRCACVGVEWGAQGVHSPTEAREPVSTVRVWVRCACRCVGEVCVQV